ncbi:MAG: hypothetical protein PG981_000040 [Wolbachia endosymbiont of Ctenocephalides orientis wCori]|nr:MAG: hypothetical protein PG981_000040 [Wolbachia endosymbiont of Ctenocephalides orientis wCori]
MKEKLGLNSKNSSIPSSKKLYRIQKTKKKSDRKIGAQVGHEGNYHARAEADEVVKVELLGACKCVGEIDRHGSISKMGPVECRSMLYEAANPC